MRNSQVTTTNKRQRVHRLHKWVVHFSLVGAGEKMHGYNNEYTAKEKKEKEKQTTERKRVDIVELTEQTLVCPCRTLGGNG